jgi:hypothetical protein
VYVVKDPTDRDLRSDAASRSPTFVAARKSPPGLLLKIRMGCGPRISLIELIDPSVYVVASKLRIVGCGTTSLKEA